MKKSSFVAMILGIIGGALFILGMCMIWGWMNPAAGTMLGLIGTVMLICLIPLTRASEDEVNSGSDF